MRGAPPERTGLARNDPERDSGAAPVAAPIFRAAHERLLRLPEVKSRTGLSRSSIYSKMAVGHFPPQKKLGAKMVGWYESQIDAWVVDPR